LVAGALLLRVESELLQNAMAWYMNATMDRLAEIVGSKIRAEVFRLLFAGAEQELHFVRSEQEHRYGLAISET
jgi:hypothetical protein